MIEQHTQKTENPEHVLRVVRVQQLEAVYVLSLGTFGALSQIESNALALVEGFEAVLVDLGEVDKYIFAIFSCDETKTFFCVEPFYDTVCHIDTSEIIP